MMIIVMKIIKIMITVISLTLTIPIIITIMAITVIPDGIKIAPLNTKTSSCNDGDKLSKLVLVREGIDSLLSK